MKFSIYAILLLSGSLFSAELTQDESVEVNQKLEAAMLSEKEAKLEIDAAKEKLKAAKKIINTEAAKHLSLSSHTELGYISTSGNTNTKAGSLDAMAKAKLDKNTLQLDIDYLYGEENNIESKNSLLTELNYDYKFSKHFAFNYLVGYKSDKFSGFDYQSYTGPGLKYIAIENDIHILNFQTNVLYSKDSEMDKFYDALGNEVPYPYVDPAKDPSVPVVNGKSNEYTSVLLRGDYKWNITESLKFIQELSYRMDTDDSDIYYVKSKTGISSKINATFSMGVNYKIDYVNTPPVGNEYTDKTLAVTLSIDY